MSRVELEDESGHTITFTQMENGRLMPTFDIEVMKNVPNFKLRDDDILICTYVKSGTNWICEICSMLMQRNADIEPVYKSSSMIELVNQEILDAKPSPRLLNTHLLFKDLPSDANVKKPKIVYLRRNPKDVAVSMYNHTISRKSYYNYTGEFKDYLKLYARGQVDYGSWFDYVKEWHQVYQSPDVQIIELTYEELKRDPIKEITKLAKFLGCGTYEDLIKAISDKCSFDIMSKRHNQALNPNGTGHIVYRKSEVGDWKNWFTVSQNEWFDKIYQENMKDSNLEVVYTI